MKIINDLFNLFFPDLCIGCSQRLTKGERYLCQHCTTMLKEADFRLEEKEMEFKGRVPVETLYARYFYSKGGIIRKIIHRFKYHHDKELAYYMGEKAGRWLRSIHKGEPFDKIIPLPLHPIKQKQRGYNQSEELSRGISKILNSEVSTAHLVRKINTHTQTTLDRSMRWDNVEGIFHIEGDSSELKGKHLLLVDDVYTTGSTLEAATRALLSIEHVKVTIFVLAIA